MKTPRIATNSSAHATPKSKGVEDSARKPFSKVLENRREKEKPSRKSDKQEAQENKRSNPRGTSDEEALLHNLLPRSGSSLAPTGEAVSNVSSAQSVALKDPIQAMVKEIWHGVNAQGQQQVDIHLNSRVFEGLRIQIVRDSDRLNIHFESASDAVAQLLNRNVGALTESLAAHGVRVGHIRVGEPETARWMAHKAQSRLRSGGQGRRRQS